MFMKYHLWNSHFFLKTFFFHFLPSKYAERPANLVSCVCQPDDVYVCGRGYFLSQADCYGYFGMSQLDAFDYVIEGPDRSLQAFKYIVSI